MDLLDRLRPRWRHSDPEVRAAAARDLGADDRDAIEALARDPDVRVRRVAVKKVDDPALLDVIARDDADTGMRETAAERARARRVTLACDDGPLAECEAALAALTDAHGLASVAGDARHEAVRRAALARIEGDRALRDVVRGAADSAIRLAALARIQDAAVLRVIAIGEGPAEVTVAAVERLEQDIEALRAIADHRTASKAARQRARALLPAGAEHAVGHKEARARQQALCSLVEGLTAERDVMRAADRMREAEHEWHTIAQGVGPRDDVAARFARACAAITDDAGSLTRRQAAADHARMVLEEGLAARRALCERVEALDGAGARHALDDARAAWHRLPPLSDERAGELAQRFAEAGTACLDRYERWRSGATVVSGVESVIVEAEALAGTSPVPPSKAWHALERRWRALPRPAQAAEALAVLDTRWKAASDRLERRRAEDLARRGELAQENFTRLQALHARVDEMVAAEAIKPNAARRELQALDAAVQDLGPLPPDERRAAWTERLSDARDRLLRRVRQEEETEEWRRWANVAAQEELIRRVEALLEANDLAEGTRQLGRLQTEWAAVATASADKSQALWERFRTVRNELRKRCDAYMGENLEKKRALCAQVADVGDATSWNETADLIKRAQAEWKAIGPVPVKYTQALWHQFREPCDRFFARRKEHFDQVDAERKQHAGKKIALCERAEANADSTDWDATTALMKQLQAEWKASGPLPRAQGEALWQRFRSACDRFFDRRNRREEIAREASLDRGRALCDVVEALATSLDGDGSPSAEDAGKDVGKDVGKIVDETWGEWVHLDLGAGADARAIDERLRAACARVGSAHPECLRGTRFDPETTRKRREKLCAKLEELAGPSKEAPKAQSLQEMALALRDRLASNTIAGGSGGGKGRREDVARELERIAASWAHLGPAFDDAARELEARYERARAAVANRAR